MQRKINTRQTTGLNARVFIAKDLAYATDATFGDFVNDAVDGEIGVFLKASGDTMDTQALIKTTALVTGNEYFIAQKQGELIKKTPTMKFGETSSKNFEIFCLPVKQVSTVGYNGTDGDISDVVPVIAVGDNFELSVIETTEGYQPYPTWLYSHTATLGDVGALEKVLSSLVAQINDDMSVQNKENEALVIAELNLEGTATSTVQTFTAVNGSNVIVASAAHTVIAGDLLRLGATTSSPVYRVKSVDSLNIELYSNFVGTSAAGIVGFEMTTLTAMGVRLTAIATGDTFHVALKESLADAGVRIATPFKAGTGDSEHIANLEYEGQIFDGTTTVNAKFKNEWGTQTNYAVATKGYDVVSINFNAAYASKALPNTMDSQAGTVIVAGPTSAGTIALPYVASTVTGATNVIQVLKTVFTV